MLFSRGTVILDDLVWASDRFLKIREPIMGNSYPSSKFKFLTTIDVEFILCVGRVDIAHPHIMTFLCSYSSINLYVIISSYKDSIFERWSNKVFSYIYCFSAKFETVNISYIRLCIFKV